MVASGRPTTTSRPSFRITRRQALLFAVFVISAIVFLYFGLPRLAGFEETWQRLREGEPGWLAVAAVLGVAFGGAAVNFSLIARPMAEMVGGTNFTGAFRTADIAALVIIMVEVSMGLFLMESLRITRLFPVIGALPDKIRVRMIAVTFVILLMLASVEAGLAYMREILMQDELATSALLRGGTTVGVLKKLVETGQLDTSLETVVINTGHGLKTLDAVSDRVGAVATIAPSYDAFVAAKII